MLCRVIAIICHMFAYLCVCVCVCVCQRLLHNSVQQSLLYGSTVCGAGTVTVYTLLGLASGQGLRTKTDNDSASNRAPRRLRGGSNPKP